MEVISLIQSCRELNDVSFQIRFKSLKLELIETFKAHEEIHFTWRTRYIEEYRQEMESFKCSCVKMDDNNIVKVHHGLRQ